MADDRIEDLEAEASFRRSRLSLYRAKSYGPRETSPAKLRELERISDAADQRLREARRRRDEVPPGTP